jgi:hypothetical protein
MNTLQIMRRDALTNLRKRVRVRLPDSPPQSRMFPSQQAARA